MSPKRVAPRVFEAEFRPNAARALTPCPEAAASTGSSIRADVSIPHDTILAHPPGCNAPCRKQTSSSNVFFAEAMLLTSCNAVGSTAFAFLFVRIFVRFRHKFFIHALRHGGG